jgi:signal transduction histidine kinase
MAVLHSEYRGIRFTVAPVDPMLAGDCDPPTLRRATRRIVPVSASGFSIARRAVRAHGGDIRIRNMPGEGCVFTIDVPLAAEAVSVPQST